MIKSIFVGAILAVSTAFTFNMGDINAGKEVSTYTSLNESIVIVQTGTGHGTGFYISDNLVATNAHVAFGNYEDQSGQKLSVVHYDGSIGDGQVVAFDVLRDLAIIKVTSKRSPLQMNTIRQAPDLPVFSIGHGSYDWYNVDRGIYGYHYKLSSEKANLDLFFVSGTLTSTGGDSGSPVFNEGGQVIGIVSRTIRFIPSIYLNTLLEQYYAEPTRFLIPSQQASETTIHSDDRSS
jgi:S1-C subfamily serine protease